MSLHALANHMSSRGRGEDSMLVHMTPGEVHGLQALAMKHGGSLTINPDTGLPEAGFLDKLLPTIIGAGISFFSQGAINPMTAAAMVGGVETVRTGDIGKGISAGLGAYGGASLTAGMTGAGSTAMANEAGALAGNEAAAYGAAQLTDAGANVYSQAQLDAFKRAAIDEGALQQGMSEITGKTTTGELLSKGFDVAKTDPMKYLKANAMPLAAAFGPAILAGQSAENNMPKTTTGMIRPYSFDPYSGTYTSGNPYQATPTRAAGGGLMGMDDGGYGPGMLDFTQKSEPVVRMAEGGVPGYAGNTGSVVGGYKPSDADIFNYFKTPNLSDTQIATDMQKFGVSAADIARATGTQGQQGNYEQRFVTTLNTPGTDASEFQAATKAVGLQGQGLATAMQGAGLSQGAQYALTQPALSDAGFTGGIIDAGTGKAVDLYNQIGYTAGALPGDKGGLEGLYGNINYVASGLQNLINTGKMTVKQAQDAALAELQRTNVSVGDVRSATGKNFSDLFTPKTVVQADVVCGPGYKKSIDGKTCVPIGVTETFETSCPTGFHYDPSLKQCVKNLDATQTTTTNVTTPTSISTAASTALPVGISGAGITNINPNGTVTTRPDLSLGMSTVRDAYEKGGGSLGYAPYAPKTMEAFDKKYTSKLTGGSKQSYDYLTGKTPYSPKPVTETGEIMKPYAESVLGIPANSSKKMYIFKNGKYEVNPEYAIPTYDKDGKKSSNLTNADVKTFMNTKPSTDAFYTWATTNNLSPEQIAQGSERPINEISKLFTGAKDLVGDDGKIDTTKVTAKEEEDIKTNWDEAAYLAAHKDVADELKTGKSVSGQPVQFTSGYEHWLKYGKDSGVKPITKKAAGGLMNMAMAHGGMAQQFDLGGYSDGGRLLRGPGDGVSDSIPATIGNKRPARLADGEFVVPARIVSELGNGSTEAGARKLYAMMDRIQSARGGTVGKGRIAKNSRAEKYLPA